MSNLYEVTLKKADANIHQIYRLSIGFQGLTREESLAKAKELARDLGVRFNMSYIIRGFREEGT